MMAPASGAEQNQPNAAKSQHAGKWFQKLDEF
jgi:hypothetical protein